jgi:hypothetical protein
MKLNQHTQYHEAKEADQKFPASNFILTIFLENSHAGKRSRSVMHDIKVPIPGYRSL